MPAVAVELASHLLFRPCVIYIAGICLVTQTADIQSWSKWRGISPTEHSERLLATLQSKDFFLKSFRCTDYRIAVEAVSVWPVIRQDGSRWGSCGCPAVFRWHLLVKCPHLSRKFSMHRTRHSWMFLSTALNVPSWWENELPVKKAYPLS